MKRESVFILATLMSISLCACGGNANTATAEKVDIQEMIEQFGCFLQDLFGQSCKTFLDIIACPFWT